MSKIKVTVVNEKGKTEDIEVEEGTEMSIKVRIVDSSSNGNSFLPIVEIQNAIFVGERKAEPRICLSVFPIRSKKLTMPEE